MEKVLKFLEELRINNNKAWFDEHKTEYKEVVGIMNAFTEKLIVGIAAFDKTIVGVTVKSCAYRIYRDVRFSPNKEPYKTHIGYYICRGGKNSGYAGYYFHIEPTGDGFIGTSILSAGRYCPEPPVLKVVREHINEYGDTFLATLKIAQEFELDRKNMLKRVPKGFDTNSKMADYLKNKHFFLSSILPKGLLSDENALLNHCLQALKDTYPFISFINEAIDKNREE